MYAISLAAFVLPYFIATPLITYYYDAKGLRKYPNFTFFSGISDIPFLYESHKGFCSRNLFEAY
jgi:hypothetical protein